MKQEESAAEQPEIAIIVADPSPPLPPHSPPSQVNIFKHKKNPIFVSSKHNTLLLLWVFRLQGKYVSFI